MLASGIMIFLAFWLLWIKIDLKTRLKLLAHHLALDVGVSVTVWIMFSGTGAGLLAATLAAVIISANIFIARKLFGYIEEVDDKWKYHPGLINQSHKLGDLNEE